MYIFRDSVVDLALQEKFCIFNSKAKPQMYSKSVFIVLRMRAEFNYSYKQSKTNNEAENTENHVSVVYIELMIELTTCKRVYLKS